MYVPQKYLNLFLEKNSIDIELFNDYEWNKVSERTLELEFIQNHIDKLSLGRLIQHNVLTEELLDRASELLYDWVITKHVTKLIHRYSIDTLLKFKKYIDFSEVNYNLVSIEFIKVFEEDIWWEGLSTFKFTADVVEYLLKNYSSRLSWRYFCKHNDLTKEQIQEHAESIYLGCKC